MLWPRTLPIMIINGSVRGIISEMRLDCWTYPAFGATAAHRVADFAFCGDVEGVAHCLAGEVIGFKIQIIGIEFWLQNPWGSPSPVNSIYWLFGRGGVMITSCLTTIADKTFAVRI